jgi:hypothetical protein
MTTPTATRPTATRAAAGGSVRRAAARISATATGTGTGTTGDVTTAGTLTVHVPHSTWSYLDRRRSRHDRRPPAPATLAARVHDYIRDTLIPDANEIMSCVCPDAGARFTPAPFLPGDADRRGFAVHGVLTLHAPRTWGEMFVDAAHPQPASDREIARDLDGFAKEVLNEKFGDHLAVLCPGAGVWFASLLDDPPPTSNPTPSRCR